MNLSVLLADRAAKFGDRTFLFFERQAVAKVGESVARDTFHQTLTFREMNDRVNQACHFLASQGLRRGDVFNLHLPNCPAFLILWFAGARLGAIMMPTNVLASLDELVYLLAHSSSKIAFTTAEHQAILQQCKSRVDGLGKIVLCDPYTDDPVSESFEALLRVQSSATCECPAGGTDLAAIMYTSGTTSKPKGVMVTHANYQTAGQTVADAIELTEDDRHFVVLPLFHGNAQYYSTMSALIRGAGLVLMDRFSAHQYFDKCIEYGCTVASLFAAPMRMLLAQPEDPASRDNDLRVTMYAQNLTPQQMQAWERRYTAPLMQLWGMTETMGPPLMNPLHGERRNWTVGKPSGDYEVALLDESGKAVAVGQEGEIAVKGVPGKTIMAGYFRNQSATDAALRNNWLYTGDNGLQDDDGYFHFVDRKKDMIKRAGENVSSGEVENVILQHAAVFECAVIGLPDELRDESIVGIVVLHQGHQLDAVELIEFCSTRLAKFRVPQRIVFRDSLPKTSVGKIQKHLLRNQLITS